MGGRQQAARRGQPGTFTVITGDSSGVSADVHDRMPVWLAPGQAEEWVAADADGAMAMLLTSEPPAMQAYRVSRAVNTPRNNTERLLEPVQGPAG
ncbi:SOS response-associated peptidase family protein [Stenotrophomonas bentonitica]